jgi:phosphatidylserine/phosphatidylglycerophosphate/cardiolipin synthase-like enzyme
MDFDTLHERVPLRLIAGRAHYEVVVETVRKAELSVWIATANLKDIMVESGRRRYRSMLSELDQLSKRGVELRLLHGTLPSRPFREDFDRHPRLVEGGLALALCPRVHFKTVIVDGRLMYLGSANWTGAGLGVKGEHRRNFELGIVTEDEAVIDQVQAYYERLWRGDECAKCRLRDRCDMPLDLLRAQ